jgi:phosphogluconate dehydratase
VNHFHAAGGTGFVIRELLDAGLLHDDVTTILGQGLRQHCTSRCWPEGEKASGTVPGDARQAATKVLRTVAQPFRRRPEAAAGQPGPRRDQGVGRQARAPHGGSAGAGVQFAGSFMAAFKAGELDRDFVAVIASRARAPTACRNCTR